MERAARLYEMPTNGLKSHMTTSQHHTHLNHHHHYQHHTNATTFSSHLHHNNHHYHQICSQSTAQSKRKEKARLAARARRSQEACIIMEMANELHITQEKIRRIDKATIVRLAIDYIKAFEFLCRCQDPQQFASRHMKQEPQFKLQSIGNSQQLTPPVEDQIEKETKDRVKAQLQQQQQQRARNFEGGLRSKVINSIQPATYQMPKLSTASIFAPKTDDMNTHFLVVDECNGKSSLVLKPDTEVLDEDDLTHLAPQAGDVSIPLEVEPLDDIVLDKLL